MEKRKQILIIGLLGILTLVISGFMAYIKEKYLTETQYWLSDFAFQAIFNIAFVLVGAFLADITWGVLGGDPNEKFQQSLIDSNTLLAAGVKTGLIDVVSSSSEYASSGKWLEIIKSAKKEVCLQGYTLLVWTRSNDFDNTLIKLAKRGVKIRLVFMHEDANYLHAGINDKSINELSLENVKQEIVVMTGYLEQVIRRYDSERRSSNKGTIEFRKVKNGLITSQIVCVDGMQYVTPYLSSVNTSHCPLFVIKDFQATLYKKYIKEFECIWNEAST